MVPNGTSAKLRCLWLNPWPTSKEEERERETWCLNIAVSGFDFQNSSTISEIAPSNIILTLFLKKSVSRLYCAKIYFKLIMIYTLLFYIIHVGLLNNMKNFIYEFFFVFFIFFSYFFHIIPESTFSWRNFTWTIIYILQLLLIWNNLVIKVWF